MRCNVCNKPLQEIRTDRNHQIQPCSQCRLGISDATKADEEPCPETISFKEYLEQFDERYPFTD